MQDLQCLKFTQIGNNQSMTKKEYIERAKKSILNRVRFHAPIVYDDKLDRRILFEHGVDVEKPIFKFEKQLTKPLLKAFELAEKEEKFNLLISTDSFDRSKEKRLSRLNNVVIFSKHTSSKAFLEMINKLNINYQSSSNYNLLFKDKFFKVNNQILNPNFEDFSLHQTLVVDDFFVDYTEFVLNGNNHFLKIQNSSKDTKSVVVEFNLPLQKGYYFFKRLAKSILVENLLTREKSYLNFICRNAKFSFSEVDGLENSIFSCINVKVKLTLAGREESFVFFNFGEKSFSFKGFHDIVKFKEIARVKCCEIFNLQVKTKNPKFDFFFNRSLPQKIWINWLNGEIDEKLEEKYLTLKRLFMKGSNKLSFVNFKQIELRELGVFNGEYYKKILVISGSEKFLRVGQTFFYNVNGITNRSLKSKEPLSVCFGE